MAIQPLDPLSERILLWARYRPKALILISALLVLVIGIGAIVFVYFVISPKYQTLTFDCQENVEVIYPMWITSDAEYIIRWKSPQGTQVHIREEPILVEKTKTTDTEYRFRVIPSQFRIRQEVTFSLAIESNKVQCYLPLKVSVYPWAKIASVLIGSVTLLGVVTFLWQVTKSLIDVRNA